MSTKSRESLYGTTIRMSSERAKDARKEADRLACEAWNYRMLGYKGPAQPSPPLDFPWTNASSEAMVTLMLSLRTLRLRASTG